MVAGPRASLDLLQRLAADARINADRRFHAVRGHLLEMAGDRTAALEAYRAAAGAATNLQQQRYLNQQVTRLQASPGPFGNGKVNALARPDRIAGDSYFERVDPQALLLDMAPMPRARWVSQEQPLPTEDADLVEHTYPVRLSADELRQELDAYLDARRRAEKAPKTIDLDRRKVLYFLQWLDSGRLQ